MGAAAASSSNASWVSTRIPRADLRRRDGGRRQRTSGRIGAGLRSIPEDRQREVSSRRFPSPAI
ncbi:hypothetical protein F2981_27100 (plasmid) [Sinorhizobium meliloti]|nr:hypothetical protein [Sinorhizobium meliloti]